MCIRDRLGPFPSGHPGQLLVFCGGARGRPAPLGRHRPRRGRVGRTMRDLSGWMNLVWGDLFAAWLMAAIFWAIAGMAAASWARTSRTLGGVIGASTLFLGTFGIVIFGIAKRQRATGGPTLDHRYDVDASGTPNVVGHDTSGFAGGSVGPTGFDSTGFDSTGSGSKGFGDPGFGQPGFGDPGFGQPSFGETGFGEPGFPASGSALGVGRPDRGTDHRSSTPAIIWLSIAAAVIAGFAAALFAPWLTLGFGVELDGTEVALVPLLCTVLAIALAVGLSWRGPRLLPALVVAWFSSWWLLIGIIALTSGGQLADLITSTGNDAVTRLSLETELAGYTTVTLGIGVTLVSLAGLLGVSWAAVAVVRCSNQSPGWSQ